MLDSPDCQVLPEVPDHRERLDSGVRRVRKDWLEFKVLQVLRGHPVQQVQPGLRETQAPLEFRASRVLLERREYKATGGQQVERVPPACRAAQERRDRRERKGRLEQSDSLEVSAPLDLPERLDLLELGAILEIRDWQGTPGRRGIPVLLGSREPRGKPEVRVDRDRLGPLETAGTLVSPEEWEIPDLLALPELQESPEPLAVPDIRERQVLKVRPDLLDPPVIPDIRGLRELRDPLGCKGPRATRVRPDPWDTLERRERLDLLERLVPPEFKDKLDIPEQLELLDQQVLLELPVKSAQLELLVLPDRLE